MTQTRWPKRVMVYIDGFNVFMSIKKRYGKQFYWLDYKKLALNYLEPNEKIVGVKYFTAYFPEDIDGKERHTIYKNALRTKGVQTILGEFQKVQRKFVKKNKILSIIPNAVLKVINGVCKTNSPFHIEYETYEEKKTDVNMAVNIVGDAFTDTYDKAILITGDNDIAPAVVRVKNTFPQKEFLVVFPFGWKGNSLKKICDKSRDMLKSELANSQLPNTINWISKPPAWQ